MNPYFLAGSLAAIVLAYGVGRWQGDEAGHIDAGRGWRGSNGRVRCGRDGR